MIGSHKNILLPRVNLLWFSLVLSLLTLHLDTDIMLKLVDITYMIDMDAKMVDILYVDQVELWNCLINLNFLLSAFSYFVCLNVNLHGLLICFGISCGMMKKRYASSSNRRYCAFSEALSIIFLFLLYMISIFYLNEFFFFR